MYQSEWTEKDVLHIFPLWNWQKDDTVDIWAYSSTYDVELFLNDQSLGRKMNPVGQYHIRWRVLLESGIIRAASYNKMEKRFLRKRSIPREYYPELNSPDKTEITTDGRDLSFVNAKVLDTQGHLVPEADNLIQFEIDGKGSIVGIDNGNRSAMNHLRPITGRRLTAAQGIIQAGCEAGQLTVVAASRKMASDQVVIYTQPTTDVNF